ncbi:MAG: tetratricopeptide repeat protein [Hydrogenophaga sp.]
MRKLQAAWSRGVWVLAGCVLTGVLTGCMTQKQTPEEQTTPRQETVRICDASGCSDRARNSATFVGTPADPEAERRLQDLTRLADNNPRAAYDLGLRLLRGDGVGRNTYQAMQWMRKAGDAGHTEAQFALGRLYLMGFEEMGSDPQEAESWLTRAAANGHKGAAELLPDAQAAKKDEQRLYRIREAHRTSWGLWYRTYPYYWVWGPSGWYLR